MQGMLNCGGCVFIYDMHVCDLCVYMETCKYMQVLIYEWLTALEMASWWSSHQPLQMSVSILHLVSQILERTHGFLADPRDYMVTPADWQSCALCRLQRDPAPHDDRPAQVPPGEAGGPGGMLPAAQQHPGGALPEGCGESWRSDPGQPHLAAMPKPWKPATDRTALLKKQWPSLSAFLSVEFYPWMIFIYVCVMIFTSTAFRLLNWNEVFVFLVRCFPRPKFSSCRSDKGCGGWLPIPLYSSCIY